MAQEHEVYLMLYRFTPNGKITVIIIIIVFTFVPVLLLSFCLDLLQRTTFVALLPMDSLKCSKV